MLGSISYSIFLVYIAANRAWFIGCYCISGGKTCCNGPWGLPGYRGSGMGFDTKSSANFFFFSFFLAMRVLVPMRIFDS